MNTSHNFLVSTFLCEEMVNNLGLCFTILASEYSDTNKAQDILHTGYTNYISQLILITLSLGAKVPLGLTNATWHKSHVTFPPPS